MPETGVWHGTHVVPEDRMITAQIGALTLVVTHRPNEWWVGWQRDDADDGTSSAMSVSPPAPITEMAAGFTVQRFLTKRSSDAVELRPLLADRPVVARPEMPLAVPAGDEATLFVSTPVWVQVALPNPDRPLLEVPTTRPSDTWFGPTTRHGVVAYASRTAARLLVDKLPPLVHRAITRVTVQNQADSVLSLDRLSVPAPNLPLFADTRGGLWTASLLAIRDSATSPARIEIDRKPPAEARDAQLVAEARQSAQRNVLSRALHVLIG